MVALGPVACLGGAPARRTHRAVAALPRRRRRDGGRRWSPSTWSARCPSSTTAHVRSSGSGCRGRCSTRGRRDRRHRHAVRRQLRLLHWSTCSASAPPPPSSRSGTTAPPAPHRLRGRDRRCRRHRARRPRAGDDHRPRPQPGLEADPLQDRPRLMLVGWYLRRAIPWMALLGCCAAATPARRRPGPAGRTTRCGPAPRAGGLLRRLPPPSPSTRSPSPVVEVTPRGGDVASYGAPRRRLSCPSLVWALVVAVRPGDLPLCAASWFLVGLAAIALTAGARRPRLPPRHRHAGQLARLDVVLAAISPVVIAPSWAGSRSTRSGSSLLACWPSGWAIAGAGRSRLCQPRCDPGISLALRALVRPSPARVRRPAPSRGTATPPPC